MRKVLLVLAFATALAFATSAVKVEGLAGGSGSDDMLQYDDGTPYWIYGGVAYYGTWFDVTDFLPNAADFWCNYVEWWFYHHPNLPWDTDMISLEVWQGDATMPVTQLAQDDVTAPHYTFATTTYATPLVCTTDFWTMCNTTVYSSTGYPSGLYDAGGNFTGIPHTFGSQDWILWDPFIPAGEYIDIMHRAEGEIKTALDSESWGAIKGLYR